MRMMIYYNYGQNGRDCNDVGIVKDNSMRLFSLPSLIDWLIIDQSNRSFDWLHLNKLINIVVMYIVT